MAVAVAGFDMDSWWGLVAPAKTPPEIVDEAEQRAAADHRQPDVRTTLGRVGFEAFSSSPGELDDFVKVQLLQWGKMVKDADIQPE